MAADQWWPRPCRTLIVSHPILIWITLLFVIHLTMVRASGFFELEVVELQNPAGRLANGGCCGRNTEGHQCSGECSTYFRLCLKEYQSNVTVSSPCTYGNSSSPVLAGNSFTFVEPDKSNARLVLPFTFRWTRSFTLILEAMNYDNASLPAVRHREIERAVYSGILVPSADWHSLTHEGSSSLRLTYRVRVQCDPNYYNATCMKFCRPRDDKFGHYTCDNQGDKACLPGWTGANCETAICKTGCHSINGRCDQPGECRCRPGWKGEFCDQCMPYPGCKHGYCNGAPWQCICETNWGGILCDQDLNYCGTHEPCLNGGTCENPAPDEFLCKCPDGFSGTNCQVVDNVCATGPCLHGGNCSVLNVVESGISGSSGGAFNCSCSPGWMGPTCQINVDECDSSPCLNGATCIDLENGYRCLCPDGWVGDSCQLDVDECSIPELCRNAQGCENTPGNYSCRCIPGFTGRQCQLNVNDCDGHGCLNGATCIDLIGEYHCACSPGFSGQFCELNIDECRSAPCANGGECVDLVDGFKCICPLGYTGPQCQIDTDLCHPNPCAGGSPCFNAPGPDGSPDYYCLCSAERTGKNCSLSSSIQQTDSCWLGGDRQTCVHGRCVSHSSGGSRCMCDPGYAGPLCIENVNDCADRPCANGGTCIDGIGTFHCVCPKGFDGPTCQHDVDDCASNPCGVNGTCLDLVADFQCRCAAGWKGRTCDNLFRHCPNEGNPCLNGGTCLEEEATNNGFACRCTTGWRGSICHLPENLPCDANPCRNGATCLNTGQSFTCVCRDGFEGQLCQLEQMEQSTTVAPSCNWDGRLYPDNSSWDEGCNKCHCRDGRAVCTRVWCGPTNCLEDPERHCGAGEICLPVQSGCIRQPCPVLGQCRPVKPGRLFSVPAATASCWPNLTGHQRLAPTCARLTLVLDRFRAEPGFSIQSLCAQLRKLAGAQSHLWDNSHLSSSQPDRPQLYILCDFKDHLDDVVQVTVSMAEKSSEYGSGNSRASAAARALGDLLTAHYMEGSSMAALVEVRVETASSFPALHPPTESSSSAHSSSESDSYVVAIVCAILAGLVVVAGLLILLLWRLRKRPEERRPPTLHQPDRQLEKSNNLQNEENLLRIQQQRRSLVIMKTLNVSELPSLSPMSGQKKLIEDSLPPSPESFYQTTSPSCIESSPIYKAPSVMDVRNNIHLAAKSGRIIEK